MKLTSHHKPGYGSFNRHVAPDPTRCAAEIPDATGWVRTRQCSRKRGHGSEGAFCKQHDPAVKAARQAEADRKNRKRWRERAREFSGPRFLDALRQIAAGHNDPRTLASEIVDDFDRLYPEVDE